MFAGIYYGGMYGGSTTSILLNTPGESSSVVTAIEGNKMAKAGAPHRRWRPRPSARSWPARSAPLLLVLLAPSVADVVVKLGAPSYFAIMLLALFAVTAVLGVVQAARLHLAVPGPGDRPGRHVDRAGRG